jgi:hypothetical protein
MSDVTDLMLRRFGVLYGEPKTPDIEAFVGEYERSMRGFRKDVISRAADKLIDAHDRRSWPTPGECHKACDAAAEEIETRRRPATSFEPEPRVGEPPSEESKARCRALVAELKRTIGGEIIQQASFNGIDKTTWNARRVVRVSRHADPISTGENSGG